MSRGCPSRRSGARHGDRAGDGGWSLIELLVVAAMLALLALIATPGFRTSMLRAHRAEATAALLALAAAQERFHLQHHAYAADVAAAPPDGLGLPIVTATGRYAIAITEASSSTFTATATARGDQSQDARCTEFSLDSTGARTATSADCWTR